MIEPPNIELDSTITTALKVNIATVKNRFTTIRIILKIKKSLKRIVLFKIQQ